MKKLATILVSLLLAGSTLLPAQEVGQWTVNLYGGAASSLSMVEAGQGVFSAIGEVFATIFTFGLYKPGSAYERIERATLPCLGVQGGYQILPWLQLTGDLTYCHAKRNYFTKSEDSVPAKVYSADRIALLPGCKFTYLNTRYFHMYSSLHLGAALFLDKTDDVPGSAVHFAVQTGLLGFTFGSRFYGNLEFGAGSEYTGVKAGIGYWF